MAAISEAPHPSAFGEYDSDAQFSGMSGISDSGDDSGVSKGRAWRRRHNRNLERATKKIKKIASDTADDVQANDSVLLVQMVSLSLGLRVAEGYDRFGSALKDRGRRAKKDADTFWHGVKESKTYFSGAVSRERVGAFLRRLKHRNIDKRRKHGRERRRDQWADAFRALIRVAPIMRTQTDADGEDVKAEVGPGEQAGLANEVFDLCETRFADMLQGKDFGTSQVSLSEKDLHHLKDALEGLLFYVILLIQKNPTWLYRMPATLERSSTTSILPRYSTVSPSPRGVMQTSKTVAHIKTRDSAVLRDEVSVALGGSMKLDVKGKEPEGFVMSDEDISVALSEDERDDSLDYGVRLQNGKDLSARAKIYGEGLLNRHSSPGMARLKRPRHRRILTADMDILDKETEHLFPRVVEERSASVLPEGKNLGEVIRCTSTLTGYSRKGMIPKEEWLDSHIGTKVSRQTASLLRVLKSLRTAIEGLLEILDLEESIRDYRKIDSGLSVDDLCPT